MIDFRKKIMGRLGNNLFQFSFLYSVARQGIVPDVYVQDYRLFEKYSNEIKNLLSEGITKIDKVAIHVRRGDYVGNAFYVDLFADDYYQRAMKELPNQKFLVFSDDIKWCKKQKIFKDCEFSEGLTEEADLNLMASCTGHIISNSSFSWWAAYLSPNQGKVVAPLKWHPDGIERTVIPPTWVRL